MDFTLVAQSSEATEQLGELIGANLRGGETIILTSDLGGGKTTFTRGLARGFGSNDAVSSPSFTLTREYIAGDMRICHFDFYRLHEAGIMKDEIAELVNDPQVVVVVEWADIIADILPENHVAILISPVDDTTRQLKISIPKNMEYITKGIA